MGTLASNFTAGRHNVQGYGLLSYTIGTDKACTSSTILRRHALKVVLAVSVPPHNQLL